MTWFSPKVRSSFCHEAFVWRGTTRGELQLVGVWCYKFWIEAWNELRWPRGQSEQLIKIHHVFPTFYPAYLIEKEAFQFFQSESLSSWDILRHFSAKYSSDAYQIVDLHLFVAKLYHIYKYYMQFFVIEKLNDAYKPYIHGNIWRRGKTNR